MAPRFTWYQKKTRRRQKEKQEKKEAQRLPPRLMDVGVCYTGQFMLLPEKEGHSDIYHFDPHEIPLE